MVGCFASWGCIVDGHGGTSFGVDWCSTAIAWVMGPPYFPLQCPPFLLGEGPGGRGIIGEASLVLVTQTADSPVSWRCAVRDEI